MAELNDIQLRIIVQGSGLENIQRLNDTLNKTTGAVRAASSAADESRGKWEQFREGLNNLERQFDAVFRAASHLQALGRDLTEMGQAGIGMLKSSVDAWADYEFGVHRAAGALGIFETTSPIFHELQRAIDETAQEARLFPAEEIAKAVYYWGSATGQTVKTHKDLEIVMDGLLPIMQTAAITETDYEKAIKGTYQIIQQYNLGLTRMATAQDVANGSARRVGEEISNTRDITEKLMMITQNTAVEYNDLIEAFRFTGSVAPALGVKFEDIALVLGRLGDMGIRGSQAGRALQQTFTKLLDPTVKASKALDNAWKANYGLSASFEDMVFPNGEFIGLAEYVDQLADVTEDMTDKERGNLIAIMTTQNELRTMIPLVEDQIRARKEGISVYDDEKFALENASAQFEKTMHLLEISWKGTMGYLRESIMPVVRAVGSEVARLATPFVETFGKIAQSIKVWLDQHPEVTRWIVQFTAIASVALIVAGAIFTAVGVLLAFGAGLAFVIKGLAIFTGIFTTVFPIIGAVIAVVTALATNFGGLRDAAIRVVEAVAAIWQAMSPESTGAGANILERLGHAILPILESVARLAAGALEKLAEFLEWIARTPGAIKVVEGIAQALALFMVAGLVARIGGIAFSIATLGTNAFGAAPAVRDLAKYMSRFFSVSSLWPPKLIENFKLLSTAIYVVSDDAKKKLLSGIAKMKAALTGMAIHTRAVATGISLSIKSVLIATGIGAIIVAATLLYEAWVNNWGGIQEKTAEVVDWVVGKWNEFTGAISQFVDDVVRNFQNIQRWIGIAWDGVIMDVQNFIASFVSFFQQLPGRIGEFFAQVWSTISTWVGNIVTTIVEFPGIVWQGIVDGFNNIMTFLGEWWTSLGDSTAERVGFIVGFMLALPIKGLIVLVEGFVAIWEFFVEWWENLTEAIGNWVTGVVNTISDWIGKLPGRIAAFFSTIWTNFVAWWENLMASTGRWITSVVTTIVDWIAKLPGRFAAWFGSVLNTVSTWFGNFIASVGRWASSTVTAIINWISQLPGRFAAWLGSVFNTVSRWFTGQFIPNIGTWTMNAVNNAIKFFRELPGKAVQAVATLGPKLAAFIREIPGRIWNAILGIGTAIVRGVVAGFNSLWGWFRDQIGAFFKGIVNGVKAALGIASPSKVFAEIGTQLVSGLAVGVRKNDDAVRAMDQQVHDIIDSARQIRAEEMNVLGGDYSFSTDGERRLVIEHRVTSPDGTVNASSREQLREIFTAEEFVSALEHMATVG